MADNPAKPAPSAAQAAAYEAWLKACTPAEHHKLLQPFAGDWTAKVRAWFAPGQPPSESTGRMTLAWVLGGRYLQQDYASTTPPAMLKGLGYWGYDNITGRYVGMWMDTLSTTPLISDGSYDKASKAFTMIGSVKDPSGATITYRQVIALTGPTTHTFESYRTGPDGREAKCLEVVYTRA